MATLIKCPVCSREVSTQAKTCPGCGHSLLPVAKWKLPLIAFGVLAAAGAAGKIYLDGQQRGAGAPNAGPVAWTEDERNTTSEAPAVSYEVSGARVGIRLAAMSELPGNDKGIVVDESCESDTTSPASEGAKLAASKGWSVDDESLVGRLTAVTISKGQEWVMGQGCFRRDMSVVLFIGSVPVAVAYADTKLEEYAGLFYTELRPDGALRLSGGQDRLADLKVAGNTIRLDPLPPLDVECKGRVKLPRIEALPYDQARNKLMANGWQPVSAGLEPDDSSVGEFINLGMVEVDACSGTGMGYCAMKFKASSSDTVDVTTIGGAAYDSNENGKIDADEFPTVSDVGVNCREYARPR